MVVGKSHLSGYRRQNRPITVEHSAVTIAGSWIDNWTGVLLEGRYRIIDVRHHNRIRSVALKNIAKVFQNEDIALAIPRVYVESV